MLHLEDKELHDLAQFFARRFPSSSQRASLLAAAKLATPAADASLEAWMQILQGAQQHPRQMRRLTRVARRVDPGDDNLQAICRLLEPPSNHLGNAAAIVGGVGSVVAVALLVVPLLRSPTASADAQTRPEPTTQTVLTTQEAPPPEAFTPPPVEPSAAIALMPSVPSAEPAAAVDPVAVAVAAAVAEEPAQPPETAAAPPPVDMTVGRCRGAEAELIGYWYAGAQRPGDTGDTITATVTTNVRADYPDVHNDFNARADRRCLLVAGDKLTLSADPIAVPGDRYWVPLYGGDLL